MPDISICKNDKCPKSKKCYRFIAEPSEYQQTYTFFVYSGDECCNYLPIKKPIKQEEKDVGKFD